MTFCEVLSLWTSPKSALDFTEVNGAALRRGE